MVEEAYAQSQSTIDFYNLEEDEPLEIIPNPIPQPHKDEREYKQLKLEL